MNDFESRARAAARAVHAAVDTPAGELTTAPSPHRGPTRALLIAAAVVIVAAVVGTTLVTREEGAGPASDVTTFCAQVQQLVSTPVDVVNGETQGREPSLEFLRDAPEEIRPTAVKLLEDRTSNRSGDVETTQRFMRWWQVRCYPDAAQSGAVPTQQRYAPVPPPAPLTLCGGSNGTVSLSPQRLVDAYGTITVYGDDSEDPYAGPMIGLARTKRQIFYSDDHAVPALVPGHPDAELIDATAVYGDPIDGFGQSVTWEDDQGFVTVIGRGYTREQAAELTSLATRVANGPDGLTLTDAALDGLVPLYTGPVATIYLRAPYSRDSPTFSVSYDSDDPRAGGANLSGAVVGDGTFAAARFFAPELRVSDNGGTTVLRGDLTNPNLSGGAAYRIAAWQEGDVMLVLQSNGGRLPTETTIDTFVRDTHELDRAEWEQLLGGGAACTWSESSSGSASGSGSSDDSSVTTVTGPTGTSPTTLGP